MSTVWDAASLRPVEHKVLKYKFERSLHLTHVGCGTGVSTEVIRSEVVGEPAEIRVIEDVIDLPAERQGLSLSEVGIFRHSKVEVLDPIQDKAVPATIAEIP